MQFVVLHLGGRGAEWGSSSSLEQEDECTGCVLLAPLLGRVILTAAALQVSFTSGFTCCASCGISSVPQTAVEGRGDECTVSYSHVITSQLSDHNPMISKRHVGNSKNIAAVRECQERTQLLLERLLDHHVVKQPCVSQGICFSSAAAQFQFCKPATLLSCGSFSRQCTICFSYISSSFTLFLSLFSSILTA